MTAVVIRLTSVGPVLFKQRRYGLHGEEIVIYKFRTMKKRTMTERCGPAGDSDRRARFYLRRAISAPLLPR